MFAGEAYLDPRGESGSPRLPSLALGIAPSRTRRRMSWIWRSVGTASGWISARASARLRGVRASRRA